MATNSNLRSLNPILKSDLRFHVQSVPKNHIILIKSVLSKFPLFFGLEFWDTLYEESATSNYYVYPFLFTYLNYNTINNMGIWTAKISIKQRNHFFSIFDAIFKPLCIWNGKIWLKNQTQRPQIRLYTNFKSSSSKITLCQINRTFFWDTLYN